VSFRMNWTVTRAALVALLMYSHAVLGATPAVPASGETVHPQPSPSGQFYFCVYTSKDNTVYFSRIAPLESNIHDVQGAWTTFGAKTYGSVEKGWGLMCSDGEAAALQEMRDGQMQQHALGHGRVIEVDWRYAPG
jgi:hypothetical protein